jgi:diadenosine tetraphosphate (Ap4A) HIT family hydrolase
MGETPEQLYERAHGALRMPPVHDWETFPFDGEMRPRALLPPEAEERPRIGEDAAGCWRCVHGEERAIWSDERWLLTPAPGPTGLPVVVLLFPRAHVDLPDLPEREARELGPLMLRVERAVRSVGDIGRVHVCRWGDGSYHLHWWFMARPARLPQLIGSFAAIWDDVLPPLPEHVWRENLRMVARSLAASRGCAHGPPQADGRS